MKEKLTKQVKKGKNYLKRVKENDENARKILKKQNH